MKVIESVRKVSKQAKHVRINRERIREFAKGFDRRGINQIRGGWIAGYTIWLDACPIDLSELTPEEKLNFLFIFNSISFSYWGIPKWKVEYGGETYERGTFSLIAALKRAIDDGIPILYLKYLSEIRDRELAYILRGKKGIEIPMIEERVRIIREIGKKGQKCGGFENIIRYSGLDVISLLKTLVREFPSFSDVSKYKGEDVFYYKRAQLLISDIINMFEYEGFNNFWFGIRKITACADYILPMVLRYLEILEYSSELAEKVDNRVQIEKDSEEENEIRSCTIVAVDELRKLLAISSRTLNDHIWLMGSKIPEEIEYHLTRTTAY